MSFCSPYFTGMPPTSAQSSFSAALGWYNITDFAPYYAPATGITDDVTQWLQESLNLSMANHVPLYLPARPYLVSKTIVINDYTMLLGADGDSFFTQDFTTGLITSSTKAMVVTQDNTLEILCIDASDVIVQNIDFVTLPGSGSGGGLAIHIYQGTTISVSNASLLGNWNGVFLDSAGDVGLENVLFVPYRSPSGGRYGFVADGTLYALSGGPSFANANAAGLTNCVVDQTQFPFTGLPPLAFQTVDAFIIQNGYNTMILNGCRAVAANRGFLAQRTVPAVTGSVNFFQMLGCTTDNCASGVAITDGGITFVEGSSLTWDTSDSVPASGTLVEGIAVAPSFEGSLVLTDNVVRGNAQSSMIGIDLEGSSFVTMNGGAVMNCGPSGGSTSGGGMFLNAPGTGSQPATIPQWAIAGVIIEGCSEYGVRVAATHEGAATLTALSITNNTNGSSSVGLLIDAPSVTTPGPLVVDACILTDNDIAVTDTGSTITTTSSYGSLPRRKTNNIGYNPVGASSAPSPTTGLVYNNSGVDQYMYADITGGNVTIDGKVVPATSGLYVVGAGGTIQTSTAASSWTWFGN